MVCIPCCTTVNTSERAFLHKCGAFDKILSPGFKCYIWPWCTIAGRLSTQVQQLDFDCETKTKDNVFVTAKCSVQFSIILDKAKDAFYTLTNVKDQIRSYVYDVVRSSLPHLELDDTFTNKDKISNDVATILKEVMFQYGITILQALITDIEPDKKVKDAMNQINASKQWINAARNKAEGDKVLMVKAAEAEAIAKHKSGQGVARQRAAIVAGLRDSIHEFSEGVKGTTPLDVMELLLLTQYFDMLKDIGIHSSANAIFMAGKDTFRDSMLQAKNTS